MPPKIITTNNYNIGKAQNLIQLLYQTRADIERRIDQLMDTEVDMEELPHVLSNISILVEKVNKLDKIAKLQDINLHEDMTDFAMELLEDREKEISEYELEQHQIKQRVFWDMIQESYNNNK